MSHFTRIDWNQIHRGERAMSVTRLDLLWAAHTLMMGPRGQINAPATIEAFSVLPQDARAVIDLLRKELDALTPAQFAGLTHAVLSSWDEPHDDVCPQDFGVVEGSALDRLLEHLGEGVFGD